MQTKLNLFESEVENEFHETLRIEGFEVCIHRSSRNTLVTIMGLNFLLKDSGNVMFQFASNELERKPNKYCLPELHKLSKEQIITFAKEVILNRKLGKYEWDYKHRCNIYEHVI